MTEDRFNEIVVEVCEWFESSAEEEKARFFRIFSKGTWMVSSFSWYEH